MTKRIPVKYFSKTEENRFLGKSGNYGDITVFFAVVVVKDTKKLAWKFSILFFSDRYTAYESTQTRGHWKVIKFGCTTLSTNTFLFILA